MRSIGIVSDSHNNIQNLQVVVDKLVSFNIDTLIHLGDFYEDVDRLIFPHDKNFEILRVPGVHHYLYNNINTKRILIKAEDARILFTHTPRKFQGDASDQISIDDMINRNEIDIMLFGHTHQFLVDYNTDSKVLFINPGHLKDFDEQGTPPTFAHLTLENNRVCVYIYNLILHTLLERRYII